MAYGLLSTGFAMKPLDVQIDEMEADARNEVGVAVTNRFKVIIAIVAERWVAIWELIEAVYSSTDPNAATQAFLDALCAITGTLREAARPSKVDLTLTGTPSTPVPSGSRAADATNGNEFETLDDATIAAVPAWLTATGYDEGDRVNRGGYVWQALNAGISAGGPTGSGGTSSDGTVVWLWLGGGTGAADVAAASVTAGPIICESGDITEIVTPVGGWDGVVNILDADVGANVETDGDLRVRRTIELSRSGDATVDAIRATVLDVDGVLACTVFHNPTDVTDADGVPPHSVEVLVQGGDDQDIWDALLGCVAAGVRTHGDEVGTSLDSEDTEHEVRFNRPEPIEIHVVINLIYDALTWPLDGVDQVKAAVVVYGDGQNTGKDAVASAISAKGPFTIEGVLDVTSCYIGTAPAPGTSATVAISRRQIAVYDTSRITVNATPGTP